jgi:Protein of unknown function
MTKTVFHVAFTPSSADNLRYALRTAGRDDRQLPQFSEHGSVTAPVASLAHIDFEDICDNDLFEQANPLPAATREKYQTLWRQLRAENAPLRILEGDALVSAPISFFDLLLMSQVSENWRKVARVVGMALLSQTEGRISDLFLAARVDALVASGRLERQGRSAVDMRHCEVRLPEARLPSLAVPDYRSPA